MPYEIILAPIRDALERFLRHQPTKLSKSRIKRLRGLARPQYRSRVDVRDTAVEVLAIVDKPDAAAWLEREGVPDEADPALGGEE